MNNKWSYIQPLKPVASYIEHVGNQRKDNMNVKKVNAPSKVTVASLSKTLYPYCLILVAFRNGFERDFTIELKQIESLMEP